MYCQRCKTLELELRSDSTRLTSLRYCVEDMAFRQPDLAMQLKPRYLHLLDAYTAKRADYERHLSTAHSRSGIAVRGDMRGHAGIGAA